MKEIYNWKMFPYEPEKKEKYLKSLKGKDVIIEIDRKKRKLHGRITGEIYPDAWSNRLKVEQKNRYAYIYLYAINKIWEKE